ncbi:MAG: hypothetical protein M5U34_31125 [Chloroflexi bacterium]|nr:hypothetical protein [Chloroflexota bacterium]
MTHPVSLPPKPIGQRLSLKIVEKKIVRGGGWTSPAEQVQTTSRQLLNPTWDSRSPNLLYSTVGFRCAYDVVP